jgi:hypothetical protein
LLLSIRVKHFAVHLVKQKTQISNTDVCKEMAHQPVDDKLDLKVDKDAHIGRGKGSGGK